MTIDDRIYLGPHPIGSGARSERRGGIAAIAVRLLAALIAWRDRFRQRRHLRRLDDRMLRDVGLTREDVRRETEKPPWRG